MSATSREVHNKRRTGSIVTGINRLHLPASAYSMAITFPFLFPAGVTASSVHSREGIHDDHDRKRSRVKRRATVAAARFYGQKGEYTIFHIYA